MGKIYPYPHYIKTELGNNELYITICIGSEYTTPVTNLPVPDQVRVCFVKIKLENLISVNLSSDYLVNLLGLAVPCPPLQ